MGLAPPLVSSLRCAAHAPHVARVARVARRARAIAVLLLVLCGTLSVSVVAQDAAAEAPDARALTARLVAHYAEHPELSVTIEQVLDVPAKPELHEEGRYQASFARVGERIALRHVGGEPELSVVVDGSRMLFVGATGHVAADTPLVLTRLSRDERLGHPLPALDLLVDLLAGEVGDRGAVVEYVAREELDGRPAHHLHFFASDVWVDAGEQPWLLRWTPIVPTAAELPDVDLAYVLRMDVRFSDWSSEPAPASTFSLAPPEGSALVTSLAPTGSRVTAADARDAALDASIPAAKLAPDVTLLSLDGSSRTLSELRGKVVVLDFWATWCSPCIQSLPILARVVDDLSARGVELFAVDVREAPAKIEAFLETRGVSWPVVLDRDGAIAKAYGVSPIPHTVIIGRDGRVFDVHIGFDDGLERDFRAKLERALAK